MIKCLGGLNPSQHYTGMHGLYVCVLPTPATLATLAHITQSLGYELESGTHATVIWSKASPRTLAHHPKQEYAGKIDKIKFWPGHDNDGYLVATLDSPELIQLNKAYTSYGARHSFDPYLPHVTLAQNISPIPLSVTRAASRKWSGTPVSFAREMVQDIKS